MFFCQFWKIFKNTLFYRTPAVATSGKRLVDQDPLFQENKQLKQKLWLVASQCALFVEQIFFYKILPFCHWNQGAEHVQMSCSNNLLSEC